MITLSQIKGAVMWHLVYYDMSRGTTCTNTEHAQIRILQCDELPQ